MELIAFCLWIFALVPRCQPTEWDGFTPWFTGSGKLLFLLLLLLSFLVVFNFFENQLNKLNHRVHNINEVS